MLKSEHKTEDPRYNDKSFLKILLFKRICRHKKIPAKGFLSKRKQLL